MYALCGLVNYLLEHFIGYCFLFFLFFSALFHLFDCHVLFLVYGHKTCILKVILFLIHRFYQSHFTLLLMEGD